MNLIESRSPTGNVVIADEPIDKEERILFSPKELLGAALAACTSATVKMFADRKAWRLLTRNGQMTSSGRVTVVRAQLWLL